MAFLITLVVGLWLLSCGASVLALYWTARARVRRHRAAFVSSCAALLTAYFGLSRVRFAASQTVNGGVEWSVDSRWFFTAALILGAAALASTLWNWSREAGRLAAGPADEKISGAVGPIAGPRPPHNPPVQRTATASNVAVE